MKKFIYVSDLKFGPDATKKQTFLFKADLEFAISEGYEYIQPKDGPVLKIVNNNELVEVDITEEELAAAAAELSHSAPEQVEFDPTDEEYCIHCHNLMLIDQIINNTLRQTNDITTQQVDTMLKLAHLAKVLDGVE